MSTTEYIFAPYLDRKAKVAVAGIATFALAVLLAVALVIGLFAGTMLAPLVPSGPTQYGFLMSVHHALPTWGTWALVFFLSTTPVVVLASWVALAFFAIDTFNVAMGVVRLLYSDPSSTDFILQVLTFVLLLAFWVVTTLATVWVWRILRFKARRKRNYTDVEVELLQGRRPQPFHQPPATKPIALRGRATRLARAATGKAGKML